MDTDNTGADLVEDAPAPYESESARYMRVRAEAKAEAAVTIAANAKAAEKAKKKARAGEPVVEGQAEFLAEAKRIEAQINVTKEV